jgi:hypothetical protein
VKIAGRSDRYRVEDEGVGHRKGTSADVVCPHPPTRARNRQFRVTGQSMNVLINESD